MQGKLFTLHFENTIYKALLRRIPWIFLITNSSIGKVAYCRNRL